MSGIVADFECLLTAFVKFILARFLGIAEAESVTFIADDPVPLQRDEGFASPLQSAMVAVAPLSLSFYTSFSYFFAPGPKVFHARASSTTCIILKNFYFFSCRFRPRSIRLLFGLCSVDDVGSDGQGERLG
jgi:hypothetical protein